MSDLGPRWWISWEEPVGEDQDFRPTTWPLPRAVPKYWCSGWGGEGVASYANLCAVVDAPTEAAAKAEIEKHWKPRAWRFCNQHEPDWRPGDRFPWTKEEETAALAALKVTNGNG